MARIGFSIGSKASSAIESSVSFTGNRRRRPKANSTSGAGAGTISSIPAAISAAASCTDVAVG